MLITIADCCSCDNDDFDLCDTCASASTSLPHAKGHVLHRIQPKKRPHVHSSLRGALGDKIICNGCGIRLKDVDIYSKPFFVVRAVVCLRYPQEYPFHVFSARAPEGEYIIKVGLSSLRRLSRIIRSLSFLLCTWDVLPTTPETSAAQTCQESVMMSLRMSSTTECRYLVNVIM